MGLEEIKQSILDEAKRNADTIVRQAKQEAKQMLADAQSTVKNEEESWEKELTAHLAALELREMASGRFMARKRLLVRKKELLDDFFDHCLECLEALPQRSRKQHISSLVKNAKKRFPVSVIYTRKGDRVSVRGIEPRVAEISGGVLVESSDGAERLDFTYEALLEHIRKHDIVEISGRLFGE